MSLLVVVALLGISAVVTIGLIGLAALGSPDWNLLTPEHRRRRAAWVAVGMFVLVGLGDAIRGGTLYPMLLSLALLFSGLLLHEANRGR